jgi:Holliday junction DNA helicase RuvA
MIAQLRGVLSQKAADRIVIDIQGVGYEVNVPFSTYYELGEPGEEVTLHIHTHVREDALSLFGFQTAREKKLFTQLISVSGIGPRLGITILSGLPIDEFLQAVACSDVRRLSSIPGVGKKTAERIALEMKDRVEALHPEMEISPGSGVDGALQRDVVSALVNLGYPRNKAEPAVSRAVASGEGDHFEVVLKEALKGLSG